MGIFLCYLQVTKLCDLGVDESVCSVGWALRGTHLAIGTSSGTVQVRIQDRLGYLNLYMPLYTLPLESGMNLFLKLG